MWRSVVEVLRSKWMRRVLMALSGLLVMILVLWTARRPILRAVGDHLVQEDPLLPVDVVYVLGGGAVDRGREAVRIHHLGLSDRFVFTGADPVADLGIFGLRILGCELSQRVAVDQGLPVQFTSVLPKGTSTQEEALALLQLAIADQVDTVMVLTDRFHTRRVNKVFRQRFADAGITVLVHGTPSGSYVEEAWWESEKGLLMVNNEYVKLLYYTIKY